MLYTGWMLSMQSITTRRTFFRPWVAEEQASALQRGRQLRARLHGWGHTRSTSVFHNERAHLEAAHGAHCPALHHDVAVGQELNGLNSGARLGERGKGSLQGQEAPLRRTFNVAPSGPTRRCLRLTKRS